MSALSLITDPQRRFFLRWVIAFTVGELVGFGALPVLGGAIALWLTSGVDVGLRALVLYCVAVIGGAGEGAVLGWFQQRELLRRVPRLNGRRWILATAMAAAFAWACGMLAPTLDDLVGLSAPAQVAIWVPASVLILFSIGVAQTRVLQGVLVRPRRWIGANLVGWLTGLPWTFVLPALLPENAEPYVWIMTFVLAGVLMGLTTGAVTGLFLLRMTADTEQPRQQAHTA